jgi:glycosyltransferase involved in cell wall biosynthesis
MMSERFPVTAVVLTRNETHNIERCLKSLAWCDECVVVDDHSTDDTVAKAESLGARIFTRRFDSFAGQRNWALEQGSLRNEWVLMLDADEEVAPACREEIQQVLRQADRGTVAFRMCRRTMFLGKWLKYSDGFPVWIMRLVRKDVSRFVDQGHGEVPVPDVPGHVGTIREPFIHYPFSRGVSYWVERHNRYSDREAALEESGRAGFSVGKLFSLDSATRRAAQRQLSRRLIARPTLRFLYHYVFKLGCLDGRAGLAFSMLMSAYESLIVVKRWEIEANPSETG